MALFEALAELVGSALISAAPSPGVGAVRDAGDRIGGFLPWLRERGKASALDAVVDVLARDIWISPETRLVAQQSLEQHAVAVGHILVATPPQSAHLVQAQERARTGVAGPSPTDSIARRIAVDIFSRARAKGAFAAAGIKDDVALFMIDRVYAHLLDDPHVLSTLTPALSEYLNEDGLPRGASGGARGIAALGLSEAFAGRLDAAGGPAYLADLRERFGIGEKAMRRLLASLDAQAHTGQAGDPVVRLEELAQWLGDVKAQLQRPTNEDADVRRLKLKAATALGEGDFEAAAAALKLVRRELREGRRRTEERLADEVAGLRAQMVEEARATASLAELAIAEQDFRTAADLFGEAALALPTAERDASWRFNLQRADALFRQAETSADGSVLNESITAYGQAVRLVADGSNQKSLGLASLRLGHALALAGNRESGTARLKDAASAYRKAISILSRDSDARTWSLAQLRLARVLALVGEREQAPAVLREAAQAYREALQELTAVRQPVDHITAQTGLGNTLLTLEEREPGTALLAEAADAYTAALALMSRAADPAAWADAQMNLGLALLGLGEEAGGDARLEGALSAFRSALEVVTRMSAPQKWALIQLNLGNVLGGLSRREGAGTKNLEQAIAAYNAALEEFRREIEPLKWAITQMNLGSALIRLGEHREKRRNWLAAAGSLVPALEVFETQGATEYAAVTRHSLRRFHESWDSLIAPPGQPQAEAPKPRLSKAG